MTSRLRALGGRINNTRTSELPKEKTRSEVICSIRFLDGLVQTFKVNKQDLGQSLLDMAYGHLGVTEKEYFGLQHGDDPVDSPRWLEASKPLRKQLKGGFPCTLHFRVRYFIPDPNTLQQEQTRHLYFLQLKMDVCEGRLTCPLNSAVVLASYAVQSHFGDFNSSIHHPGYLADSQFIPDQNDDFLSKVESLHEQHSGLKQSEAESCYINIARTLDFYGVELHGGRDLHNLDLMIGIASAGIAVYRKYICTSFYPWVNILKISFKRKKFFIHQRQKQAESREHIVAFNMLNYRSCKNLWKSCVEHHSFFQAKKLLPQEKNVLSQYWTPGSCSPDGVDQRFLEDYHKVTKGGFVEDASQYYCDKSDDGDGYLVLIRITPDEEGRFGFNLKGGVDQKMPLVVSRINPESPADTCMPKLNEGDQIVLINGRDISIFISEERIRLTEYKHNLMLIYSKYSGILIVLKNSAL